MSSGVVRANRGFGGRRIHFKKKKMKQTGMLIFLSVLDDEARAAFARANVCFRKMIRERQRLFFEGAHASVRA